MVRSQTVRATQKPAQFTPGTVHAAAEMGDVHALEAHVKKAYARKQIALYCVVSCAKLLACLNLGVARPFCTPLFLLLVRFADMGTPESVALQVRERWQGGL